MSYNREAGDAACHAIKVQVILLSCRCFFMLAFSNAVHHQHLVKYVSAPQTVIEKHKMNVPETMNEVLDMSDDEGELSLQSVCKTHD